MRRRSLTFRLAATSITWVVGSLVAAGVLLVLLFRDHIERRFDQQLYDHLEELVAASEISPDGGFALTWRPSDPRFERPHSGWYWQVARAGRMAAASASLWHDRLDVFDPRSGSGPQIEHLVGPEKRRLRAIVEDITLPRASGHFTFVVAGPASDIQRDVDRFASQLAATLSLLGLGLLGTVLLQVRFGLRPLKTLRRALAEIRSGRAHHLPDTFPDEVQPVVSELNALLDHNAAVLERARTQAGNLAHALKNPLAVARNEARNVAGERGRALRERLSVVSTCIDRYLFRARAAGTADILRARTPVKSTIEDLRFSMERLHEGRRLDIRVSGTDGLFFRGDRHDLEEMVGNLLDNACKWAQCEVLVTARRADGRLLFAIEDDGPGIPEDRRGEVLERGRRLDETVPGAGLGLDIVQDLAELYRGRLSLAASSLGGIRAELDLPAAD
jgi:signal transduction histidine kinase